MTLRNDEPSVSTTPANAQSPQAPAQDDTHFERYEDDGASESTWRPTEGENECRADSDPHGK